MHERPFALPFDPAGIVLDRRRGLSQQLYQALRARVLDGRLGSGTRLPATRDLAAMLSLSRNSVVRAYDQLYAEGYIESRVGDGTYVSQLPKLSTQLSTGLSQGLSTGLSTICLSDTEDLSSSGRSGSAMERLKTHHLPPPRAGAPRAFRVGVPAFDYSLSSSGPGCKRVSGENRMPRCWAMATLRANRCCESLSPPTYVARAGLLAPLNKL